MAVGTALTDRSVRCLANAIGDRDATNEIVLKLNEAGLVSVEPPTTAGLGAVAGTGVAITSEKDAVVHKTLITITALSVTTTDAGAAGAHGSQKIYDFPEGNILVLGGVMDLTTLAGAGGIADTAALISSLGTVAAVNDNATLTTTEANIIPSTSGTLVAGAGTMKGKSTTPAPFDGTTTPVDVFLNFAMPDAGSTANDTLTVSGTVTLIWINLGDVA